MTMTVIANHYLVQVYKQEKSAGGIYLPGTSASKSLMEVLQKGDGHMVDGTTEVMYAEVGDLILLADEKAIKEVPNEEGLYIISNKNIIAVDKKEKDE